MNNSFFYLPFSYFFRTRLKTTSQRVSWILIYLLPVFFMLYYYHDPMRSLGSLVILYLLGVTAIYTVYELGYIRNDTEAVQGEAHPTLRLSGDDLGYYQVNKWSIYLYRCFISLACVALIPTIWTPDPGGLLIFLWALVLIFLLYLVYNKKHGRWKILLHFMLVCLRFMAIPFLINGHLYAYPSFWLIILVFPLPNLIERASERKFDFPLARLLTSDRKAIDLFRVYYYLLLSVIAVLSVFYSMEYQLFCTLALYFLLYRLLIFLRIFSFAKRV